MGDIPNPTAKISYDFENMVLMSNYADGVNIKITSLDPDAELKKEEGWYDYGYQQLSEYVNKPLNKERYALLRGFLYFELAFLY